MNNAGNLVTPHANKTQMIKRNFIRRCHNCAQSHALYVYYRHISR